MHFNDQKEPKVSGVQKIKLHGELAVAKQPATPVAKQQTTRKHPKFETSQTKQAHNKFLQIKC